MVRFGTYKTESVRVRPEDGRTVVVLALENEEGRAGITFSLDPGSEWPRERTLRIEAEGFSLPPEEGQVVGWPASRSVP